MIIKYTEEEYNNAKTEDKLTLQCEYCSSLFKKRKAEINQVLYNKHPNYCKYCNEKCYRLSSRNKKEYNCTNCGTFIYRGKSESEKVNNIFCSRSCSAIFNNKRFPKRQPKNNCIKCDKIINSTRSRCGECYKEWKEYTSNRCIKDLTGVRKYQKHSQIRNMARVIYNKSDKPKCCTNPNCNYCTHYEICHIKAINTFPEDTPISVVNSLDNLRALCPNCHWEFDNGLLKL